MMYFVSLDWIDDKGFVYLFVRRGRELESFLFVCKKN